MIDSLQTLSQNETKIRVILRNFNWIVEALCLNQSIHEMLGVQETCCSAICSLMTCDSSLIWNSRLRNPSTVVWILPVLHWRRHDATNRCLQVINLLFVTKFLFVISRVNVHLIHRSISFVVDWSTFVLDVNSFIRTLLINLLDMLLSLLHQNLPDVFEVSISWSLLNFKGNHRVLNEDLID